MYISGHMYAALKVVCNTDMTMGPFQFINKTCELASVLSVIEPEACTLHMIV